MTFFSAHDGKRKCFIWEFPGKETSEIGNKVAIAAQAGGTHSGRRARMPAHRVWILEQ